MPTCNWSLLCPGAAKPDQGSVDVEHDAQLVVTFENAGKVTVAHDDDGKTITIEGDITLKRTGEGDIRFVGGAGIDTSGVTSLSGKLVFDLTKNASFEVNGEANPQSRDMEIGAMLTIRFS
jgi:hypothetical protein